MANFKFRVEIFLEIISRVEENAATRGRGRCHRHRRTLITGRAQPVCQAKPAWLDLGPGNYPRLLRTVECDSTSCGDFLSYRCVLKLYTVTVLQPNTGNTCGDERLPETLREDWSLRDVNVPIYCTCIIRQA